MGVSKCYETDDLIATLLLYLEITHV